MTLIIHGPYFSYVLLPLFWVVTILLWGDTYVETTVKIVPPAEHVISDTFSSNTALLVFEATELNQNPTLSSQKRVSPIPTVFPPPPPSTASSASGDHVALPQMNTANPSVTAPAPTVTVAVSPSTHTLKNVAHSSTDGSHSTADHSQPSPSSRSASSDSAAANQTAMSITAPPQAGHPQVSSIRPIGAVSVPSAMQPTVKPCQPHMWVAVGQPLCGEAGPPSAALRRFPPFREEPRHVPSGTYLAFLGRFFYSMVGRPVTTVGLGRGAAPILFRGGPAARSSFLRGLMPTPWAANMQSTPAAMTDALLTELSELMSHYKLRFWLESRSWSSLPLVIGVDLYSLWILQWISKVYVTVDYKLDVRPDFVIDRPEMPEAPIAATFSSTTSGAAIHLVGYAPPNFVENTSKAFLQDVDYGAVERSPTLCTQHAQCVATSKIFPLHRVPREGSAPLWLPAHLAPLAATNASSSASSPPPSPPSTSPATVPAAVLQSRETTAVPCTSG
eukprot:RCo027768